MPLVLTPRAARGGVVRLPGALRRDSGTISIGRDPASDLPLDHPLASGRHCTVSGSGAQWQLHDSSTNGTLLNGERIVGARTLREGDVIGIAEIELHVSIAMGAAAPDAAKRLDDWGRGPAAPAARPQPTAAPAMASAGDALTRSAIEGIASLSRARRKAREQLGVPVASEDADPLGAPGDVLARLQRMPPASATGAVTAACEALAAHERALLAAMQGTFRRAMDHFAPAAIKQRAKTDADAWKAYERAFAASSDGFTETFAQELAKAYREAADR
ncbi:FHA domain-containing protein [Sphingomonas radiodurans]|uniref:FHA domain-containing protein n=1 Tax=Sphingomonas radiodurans TaxID=2890321 RepID=UPI001E5C65A4|nr:FHA domain-containing protein [Sphingomonas radiodurans]WBH16684.1 FHA domain-containing protein [Sphingomonas radiodurans]